MLRVWLRGVHGSGWVRLREFFYPTHHGALKKSNPLEEFNPTKPTWIGLGWVEPMGWTVFIFYFIFLLLLLLLN